MNKQLHILIAEDNELMQAVMKALFNHMLNHPQIVVCSNLQDTLKEIRQSDFDFLLLDINMPGGDSQPETIKEIHAIKPGLKICMFTGNNKDTLAPAYLSAGAIGFIQKDDKIAGALEEVLASVFN